MTDSRRRSTRLLILTQYFPPETGAPQARLSELAKRLHDHEFDVQVLTALPNYPIGKIFSGYRGHWIYRETIEGVRVIRTPIYPSRDAAFMKRLANYFSFVISSALLGPFLVRRPDIILVESPPLFLGITAAFLKTVFRAKLVFNVSDLWPESAVFMGVIPEGKLVRIARWLERRCYTSAELCTGQSEGICEGIRRVAPEAQVMTLPNGCDAEVFRPEARSAAFRTKVGNGKTILVGYAGLLGLAQGVDVILDVASRLRGNADVQFVIIGDGPERERIHQTLSDRSLDNVTMFGHAPRSEMPSIVASFDLAIIPLRHSIPGALPSKTYEAMSCEVPVIMVSGGEGARLVRRASCGVAVDFENIAGISEAVKGLAADSSRRRQLGTNGRAYVVAHNDRQVVAHQLAVALKKLT
jgi:glycosyltransferase involved in cell wall biosynthesis